MKRIFLLTALFAFSAAFAQEPTNKKETTTKVKTTVSDSKGEETAIKETTKTEKQNLALRNFDGENFSTVMRPSKANTEVNYMNEGVTYQFVPKDAGYEIIDVERANANVARLYPTSQKGYYIYSKNDKSSFGYFNEDGDFVVESYDPDGDGVKNYIYKIDMDYNNKEEKKMRKNKME